MPAVVIDSTDLDAIVADATLPEAPKAAPKVEVKSEEKAVEKSAEAKADEADDIEGEDGLTPRQKRDMSAQMLKAIGKKHRALREAEEFADEQFTARKAAERRAEQLEAEARRAAQPAQVPAQTDEKPKRENFESDEKFNDAVIDWKVGLKFAAQKAKDAREAAEARQAQILEEAKGRVQKAMELVPDFQEVMDNADMKVPPVIAGYMQESELFAELGYHFAHNPDLLEKLSKLSPVRALVEVGKIESTLAPFTAQSVKDPPNGEGRKAEAPSKDGDKPSTETGSSPSKPRAAVITPVNTSSGTQVEKAETEMSSREALEAWRQKNAKNLLKRVRH